ncbi:MAG TPA: DUF2800 domain-containing protein [Erysipelotrichaceae bacterium]|nr:DUF2800 domain-containing protein [Erysipelotrichaceae bacterium]
MPPKTHSVLAPSSKEWTHCGFSAKFLATKEDETNEMSEFGSECHELAEHYIRRSLKLEDYESGESTSIEDVIKGFKHYSDEMEELANGYANYVISTVDFETKRTGKKPIVLIEQQLDMDYAPDTHGTLDCGIIAGDTLTIIDNKTGYIKVDSFDETLKEVNSQLAIYGLYTYKCFKDLYPIKNIRLVIYQKRINNISDYTLTADELVKWEQEFLIPATKEALSENPKAVVGSHCKYCPGRNVCAKRKQETLKGIDETKTVDLLSDDEIELLLPRLDSLIAYAEDIKAYALKKATEQGKKWKGYKLVESITKRKISDEDTVSKILVDAGFDPYAPKKLMTISELQKKVGKDKFEELVGSYVTKPKGQPVLAPESDAREEIKINKEI